MRKVQIDARHLPPPDLVYQDRKGQPSVVRVGTGEWNLRGMLFHTGASLGPFAVASFDSPTRDAGGPAEDPLSVEVRLPVLVMLLVAGHTDGANESAGGYAQGMPGPCMCCPALSAADVTGA